LVGDARIELATNGLRVRYIITLNANKYIDFSYFINYFENVW